MNVTPELDLRFREAALREGLVDVRYDVVTSPVGDLFVAATTRGLCPRFEPVRNLSGRRHVIDLDGLDELDVADDGELHARISHEARGSRYTS